MNQHSLLSLSKVTFFCVQFSLFAQCFADAQAHLLKNNDECDLQLVADVYPGAQKWYQTMVAKYPQASLEKIQFGISDNYESGQGIIFFPEWRLRDMQQVFGSVHPLRFTEEMFVAFAQEEWLLLHEAAHVLKNDTYHGAVAITATTGLMTSMVLACACAQNYNKLKTSTGILTVACTAAVGYAALILYGRFQESRADDFANQNADAQALKAGKSWFDRLNTLMNFENISIPDFLNSFSHFLQDPIHPTPKSRALKVLQALIIRFGQIA